MKSGLIVIDGLDGSGKTTQISLLCRRLEKAGKPFKEISFPDYAEESSALVKMYLAGEFGGSPDAVGAYAASSFYAVDRYASFKRHWEADYRAGSLIIAARYTTSNAVHQMSKLPREEWEDYLRWLEDYEYGLLGLPRPDTVIFLDMTPEVAQKLLSGRYDGDESKKDIHERDKKYLLRCRESAFFAAERLGWSVIGCDDGENAFPPEEITNKIVRAIEK